MPFKSGTPKPPTSGRKKGTKNKTTSFKEACDKYDFDILAWLIRGLDAMPPFQQVEYLTKLLEFYYPKQRHVHHDIGDEELKEIIKAKLQQRRLIEGG